MPWCPKCKNEYRDGVRVCADCGEELIDSLPDEDEEQIKPVIVLKTDDKDSAIKIAKYLRYGGILTALVTGGDETESDDTDDFSVMVAEPESEAAMELLPEVEMSETLSEEKLGELFEKLGDKMAEIESEEANEMLSELRTEESTVYVKKQDKYADLRFSGFSFIGFGLLGALLVALNIAGVIGLFNEYSTVVMCLVFIAFIAIGISSLRRAKSIKNTVNVEREFTDQVQSFIDDNVTDELIDKWYDEKKEEQDNYFDVISAMTDYVAERFPNINRSYIEEMVDERYNTYLEDDESLLDSKPDTDDTDDSDIEDEDEKEEENS